MIGKYIVNSTHGKRLLAVLAEMKLQPQLRPKRILFQNGFSKSLILSKQPKKNYPGEKSSKISIFDAIFRKTKRKSATQLICIFLINMERLYLVQLHILRRLVHTFD